MTYRRLSVVSGSLERMLDVVWYLYICGTSSF